MATETQTAEEMAMTETTKTEGKDETHQTPHPVTTKAA
jgi:hypothetical protein